MLTQLLLLFTLTLAPELPRALLSLENCLHVLPALMALTAGSILTQVLLGNLGLDVGFFSSFFFQSLPRKQPLLTKHELSAPTSSIALLELP